MSNILVPLIMTGLLAGVVVLLSPTIQVRQPAATCWQTEIERAQ